MRALRFGLLAVTLLLVAPSALAQGTSFSARVGRNPVGLGEGFSYEVTLSVESGSVENYGRPEFRGFRVIAEQPSRSTQIQMGGGGSLMRTLYGWHYQLVPLQKGKLTIEPATVRVDGRELRTEKVTVSVVEAGQAPAPAPVRPRMPRGFPGFPDPGSLFPGFDEPEEEVGPAEPDHPAGQRNFLRVLPSKTRAFVGEQITVEWSLCLVERQSNYAPTREPRADGFWVEELEIPQNQRGLSLTEQVIDGRTYLVAPLMRKALFGLKPGRYTITPLEADVSRVGFFGAPVRSEHLKADVTALEILPLPPGAPAGFDPSAVGRFTLSAEVDRDHVQVGDAVTLKVRVEGQGNLRKLPLPAAPRLDGFKVYEPKVAVDLQRGDEIGGSKTAEYLLLPERPGETEIPALTLAYFDPQKAAYATVHSAPVRLFVTGEALAQANARPAPTSAAGGSENLLAIDVRPLRNRATLRRELGAALYGTPLFGAVVVVPPALLLGLSLFGLARARWGHQSDADRRRKLRRAASRRLHTATVLLHEGRLVASLGEIERVLRAVLTGKLGDRAAGMSRDELRAALVDAGATTPLIDGTVAALDACDRARFAPGSITAEEASGAIDRAGEIIEGFDRLAPRTPGGAP